MRVNMRLGIRDALAALRRPARVSGRGRTKRPSGSSVPSPACSRPRVYPRSAAILIGRSRKHSTSAGGTGRGHTERLPRVPSINEDSCTHAPTPTLPRKRGRERTAAAARSTHTSQDDATSHHALLSRTSAASALARAERDPGPSARRAKLHTPLPQQRVVWPLGPSSRSHTLASAGTRELRRKLKSSHRPAPPPATNPRGPRSAAATAARAPRAAPGHRSASTSRHRSCGS